MTSTPSPKSKVLVFGAGNFGSCLADHLGDSQHDVFMWSREKKLVEHFNLHHRNPRYLVDHAFSPNIKAVGPELPEKEFIAQMDVLLFAIPTQGLRFVVLRHFVFIYFAKERESFIFLNCIVRQSHPRYVAHKDRR
jgi:glycerol-3-phosphate dehydrogenase